MVIVENQWPDGGSPKTEVASYSNSRQLGLGPFLMTQKKSFSLLGPRFVHLEYERD